MKILVDKEIIPFNEIHKNCLKNTDSIDYIDDATEYSFTIWGDDNQQIGEVEACLEDDKAGLQITRLKQKEKNLQSELNILSSVINYIWDYVSMNHCVLAIHIWIEGSGITDFTLFRLGFIGQAAQVILGSKLVTLLNPSYKDIVYEKTFDQETIETLINIYNRQQKRKLLQQQELKAKINTDLTVLGDDELPLTEEEMDSIQKRIELYQECLKALGDEDIPKNRR